MAKVKTFQQKDVQGCPNRGCPITILPPGVNKCPQCGSRAHEISPADLLVLAIDAGNNTLSARKE